jgi:hypothetical protein
VKVKAREEEGVGRLMKMHFLFFWTCVLLVQCACTRASVITINWGKNETKALANTINTGDIVNWVWADSSPHGIKSIDAKFASSTIVAELGYNYSVQFWGTGTFSYECFVHSTMSGSITVVVADGEPTSSPTAFSTSAPDLTTSFAVPKVVQSGRALPAEWTLRLEIRTTRVFVNEYISFNTRSFCYIGDCRLVGPSIYLKAGDVVTLIIENHLGSNLNSTDSTSPQPNTTRLYMHGLHTDPYFSFNSVQPGTSETFELSLNSEHATGVHWYCSDTPGAAELHAMNGLVGAFYIEPQRVDDVPFAIQNAASFLMVVTKLVVVQETERSGGHVSQGCSANSTCDSVSQSPLCTGSAIMLCS